MANNPILNALHATRERLLAEAGGTVTGLLNHLRAEQASSQRPTYKPSDNKTMNRSGEVGRYRDGESNPATRLS